MEISTELLHWIPTPILAIAFWFLLKRAFTSHEEKLGVMVADLKTVVATTVAHDIALALLKKESDKHEVEITRHRERIHDYGNKLTVILYQLGIEGSGPKRDPRSG